MDYFKRKIPRSNKTIMVAGHFNPAHTGHLKLINAASEYGKVLVVVANNVQAKKKRPKVFMDEKERREFMNGIKNVQYSTISIDTDKDVCKTLNFWRPAYFASGCSKEECSSAEKEICEKLNIKMLFNVGGPKIQSSSKLLYEYSSVNA